MAKLPVLNKKHKICVICEGYEDVQNGFQPFRSILESKNNKEPHGVLLQTHHAAFLIAVDSKRQQEERSVSDVAFWLNIWYFSN